MEKQRKLAGSGFTDRPHLPKEKYTPPEVIYEEELEVRAGSPLGRMPGTEFLDPVSPLYKHNEK